MVKVAVTWLIKKEETSNRKAYLRKMHFLLLDVIPVLPFDKGNNIFAA